MPLSTILPIVAGVILIALVYILLSRRASATDRVLTDIFRRVQALEGKVSFLETGKRSAPLPIQTDVEDNVSEATAFSSVAGDHEDDALLENPEPAAEETVRAKENNHSLAWNDDGDITELINASTGWKAAALPELSEEPSITNDTIEADIQPLGEGELQLLGEGESNRIEGDF